MGDVGGMVGDRDSACVGGLHDSGRIYHAGHCLVLLVPD